MLYARWRQIAAERGDAPALHEVGGGRSWTFAELARDADAQPALGDPVAFPQGGGAAFILEVLRAWRDARVVCPLEAGQPAPRLASLPAGSRHLKTTSGTSGAARFVRFTGAQLAADADNIVATMGLRPDSPNLGVISLAHSYGFSNLVLPLLLHGIPLTLGASPLPEALRVAAATGRNWTLPAVPALWRAWLEAEAIPADLRLAISAGAPLPLALEQAVFERCGLKLHNFLGSSECGGIAFDRSPAPRTDATLAGEPLTNVRVGVSPEGCLTVRGNAVGAGYWPDDGDALRDGCFVAADLAELRAGCVHLLGRAGDVINVAGRKVSPETIERVIAGHPAVRECLVLGLPGSDAARGDTVAAVIATRNEVSVVQLREFLHTRLPDWQIPREWRLVESLAANARGKLSRAEWRGEFNS